MALLLIRLSQLLNLLVYVKDDLLLSHASREDIPVRYAPVDYFVENRFVLFKLRL